jgi:hypothetical protein
MNDRSNGRRLDAAAALIALAAAAFLYSAVYSVLAPCGVWDNLLFGVPMWTEADPAGYYLVSAHQLYAFHGRLLYPGHPGLPLQILLNALQWLYYGLAAPAGQGFTAFVAKNFAQVYFYSKMTATALHAASFGLLYAFARKLLGGRERAALFAVFGYATSLPVVYYVSRVSVEPLMIVFFLGSFLCVWRSLEETRSPGRSALWAAAAGAASIAGLTTKFHLLWPLPALCFAHLVFGDEPPWKRSSGRLRASRAPAAAFAAAALAALALSALLLDWRDFFAYWAVGGMDGGTVGSGLAGLVARQAGVLAAIVRGAAAMPAANWLPGETKSGAYFLCELPMLAAAAWGAVLLFRRGAARAGRWFWPCAAVAYTVLIWAYRCLGVSGDFHGFHYLFVLTALAAVPFGAASDALFERRRWTGSEEACAGLALVLLVHAFALCGAVGSRSADAASYRRTRAFAAALAGTREGERVALLGAAPEAVVRASGLAVIRDTAPLRSALMDELFGDFVSVDRAELERLATRPGPGERRVGAVVAIGLVDGGPAAQGPFKPEDWLAATAR